jgi:hypothetical protein
MLIYTISLLTACTADVEKEDIAAAADTSADTAAPPTELPDTELHGSIPAESLPLPAFSATGQDGTARGPDDLRGHPTAMWFFPAAGTYG